MPILRVGYFWPAAVQLPRCPVTFSLIGVRFAADAALEGTGFEPSVPLQGCAGKEAVAATGVVIIRPGQYRLSRGAATIRPMPPKSVALVRGVLCG